MPLETEETEGGRIPINHQTQLFPSAGGKEQKTNPISSMKFCNNILQMVGKQQQILIPSITHKGSK